MKLHAWVDDELDGNLAWITKTPKALEKRDWKLATGVPSADWFPPDVVVDLARNKGSELGDVVPTVIYLQVVSGKLKALLERESGARWEMLPVKLRDKQKRVVDAPYFIANLLDVAPCADLGRSKYVPNKVIPGEVDTFHELVLDPGKVPADRKIFRMKEQPRTILVREDLVRAITAAGCKGVLFPPAEEMGVTFE